VDDKHCKKMEQWNRCKLLGIEGTDREILEVDCVFKGKTEFPKSFYDSDNNGDDED
jgi:hypothetical protein